MDSKALSVLVTGSSGFIGTHVVKHLHEAGHHITALDYQASANPLPEGVKFYQCDIRQGLLPNDRFDAVVHLAALAGVRPSLHDPLGYEFTNVIGTIRLLDFCRRMAIPTFVFASSSSVYGPETPLPAREDHPANPCSPYALTKLHGEQWGALYARLHGLRFLALRFFSVWGQGQRPDLALENFRHKIETDQPIVIYGDGTQRRDLTHVSDVARAVELALRWQGRGSIVLNIGTGRNHSVMDMVDAAIKSADPQHVGANPPAARVHHAAHPADVPETLASTSAVREHLGWQPTVFFPDAPVMADTGSLKQPPNETPD